MQHKMRHFAELLVILMILLVSLAMVDTWKYNNKIKNTLKHRLMRPSAISSVSSSGGRDIQEEHYYVYLGEFMIPIIRNHKVDFQIYMQIQIEVDPKYSLQAGQRKTFISNEFRMQIMDFLPDHLTLQGNVDEVSLREKLVSVCDELIGKGAGCNVLIDDISRR